MFPRSKSRLCNLDKVLSNSLEDAATSAEFTTEANNFRSRVASEFDNEQGERDTIIPFPLTMCTRATDQATKWYRDIKTKWTT